MFLKLSLCDLQVFREIKTAYYFEAYHQHSQHLLSRLFFFFFLLFCGQESTLWDLYAALHYKLLIFLLPDYTLSSSNTFDHASNTFSVTIGLPFRNTFGLN